MGYFFSIQDAKTVHPDSVKYLRLGNSELEQFPEDILKYKNLIDLSFCNCNIAEIGLSRPWALTESERRRLYRIQKKYPHVQENANGLFPITRKTKIKKIPEDISLLTKLSSLCLNKKDSSRKMIQRLKKLLPNCSIIISRRWAWSDYHLNRF
jgi:Leucine-rich repeat (LRR) protein